MSDLPRGLRNCNPLNIRRTPKMWRGEVAGQDPAFKTFESLEIGVCEAGRLLLDYGPAIEGQGKHVSVATIIARWAPASENDTLAYAEDVAQRLGVSTAQRLDLRDPIVLQDLIRAMARHENGAIADTVLTPELVAQGVALALA